MTFKTINEVLAEYSEEYILECVNKARATPALPQGEPEPVAMFCRAEHSGDLGLQWNPAFDPYEGALLYSGPPKPQALPQGVEETEFEQDLRYRIEAGIVLLEMAHPNLETLIETLRRCAEAIKRPALPEGMAIVPVEFIQVLQDAPEINPSNYDHDQVCRLNTAVNEALSMLAAAKEKGE